MDNTDYADNITASSRRITRSVAVVKKRLNNCISIMDGEYDKEEITDALTSCVDIINDIDDENDDIKNSADDIVNCDDCDCDDDSIQDYLTGNEQIGYATQNIVDEELMKELAEAIQRTTVRNVINILEQIK